MEEARKISPSIVLNLIRNLIDAGFIVKANGRYMIVDPVLKYAVRKRYSELLK